ncbi:type IV pilus assembly PilZ [Anaeromyxobacter dehalogenans 2CP-1]|uniref:Type IV pilus assembly PilZ n=1 Tax=Anaeromyxobacter dehalogenans (strain ATCC BAA-258 / DSM 21875 / 2CP-1) TaxID=455488 RepID=B8J6D3_ANAD2|nr:PilZ domain-containing protein [Anaeromyxobacter dehalogenans]ACL65114.1 type IV pilus assembly PilZ [Anaeromyxobacter dehalogenans 2CP-1]
MASGNDERRRLARIPLACRVVVTEKLAEWTGETLDIAARGCRLTARRPVSPGALVQIAIETGGSPLLALGQVVWARRTAPLEIGVAFAGDVRGGPSPEAGHGAWLDALLAERLRTVLRRGGRLGALGAVQLQLGAPPGVALGDAETAVLRRVRRGDPLGLIACSQSGADAVLALLAAGTVTVARPTADPEGWRRAFAVLTDFAREGAPQPPAPVIVLDAGRRTEAMDELIREYLRDTA